MFALGILFVCNPFPAHAQELLMHLKFDEGTGTTPQDATANNIDGSFSATQPTWTATVPSVSFSNPYALSFTGTNDSVSVSWPAGHNFAATDPRTFSFWYRPTANGEGAYSRLLSWTSDQLEIAGTEGGGSTHKITYYDGNWHATDITLSIGTWYHVTFTYDGTTAKFYIGGELQDEHSLAGRALSGTMMIGNRVQEGNEGINGIMDDIRIYDYALDADQVGNLTAGSDNPDSPPDSTAPSISSVESSTSSTGATISWTTNEAASTKVVYSLNAQFASSTAETATSTRVTSHSTSLTGLLSCATYNFKVVSRDAAGNAATSSVSTFSTTGCAGGATPTSATSTSVTVSSVATTTATDSGRTISVETPANFTSATTSVVIQIKGLSADTVLTSIGKPSSSISSAASIVFNVTALIDNVTELDSFDVPVTVSYTYTDDDIDGLSESSLEMYHYADGSWTELDDCSVNAGANTITCTAPHFSVFAIFGTASTASSSSGGGGITYGCKDPKALNYEFFSAHLQSLCQYASTPATGSCPAYRFTRSLKKGMQGEDVRSLQKFLNCQGFILGTSGPGAPGRETNLFADRTFQAVVKFQEKYADEILKPGNLSKGTGFFATYSQKKAHALTGIE